MSISTLFSGVGASSPADPLSAPTPATQTSTASLLDAVGGSTDGSTSTSVSDRAKLLKQLQQLSQSDPAEFKKVTADIATALQAQAQKDGGQEGKALSALASKFQQASQTGSVTPLEPKHHGGHHHHGSGASATAQASAAYQQSSGQDGKAQAGAIISQVLTQDLSSTATNTAGK